MKSFIIIFLGVFAATSFTQIQPPNLDSTWAVFIIDESYTNNYLDMYTFVDSLEIGIADNHEMIFTDIDGNGYTDVIGTLNYDSGIPDYSVSTWWDSDTVRLYTVGMEYVNGVANYNHFYGGNSYAPLFITDIELDGELELVCDYYDKVWGYCDYLQKEKYLTYRGVNFHSLKEDSLLWKSDQSVSEYFLSEDLDLDGRMEILASYYNDNDNRYFYYLYEYINEADTFAIKFDFDDIYEGFSIGSATTGDLNGDGINELIIVGGCHETSYKTVALILDTECNIICDNIFASFEYDVGGNSKLFVTNDMDGNGKNELIFMNNYEGTKLLWYEMEGNEMVLMQKAFIWLPRNYKSTTLPRRNERICDVNYDGYDDIGISDKNQSFVLSWDRVNEEFIVHSYLNLDSVDGLVLDYHHIQGVDFGDVDNDNFADILISYTKLNTYWYSTGSLFFSCVPYNTKYLGEPRPGFTGPTNPTTIANSQNVAQNFILKQNYPNPFNPITTISFNTNFPVKVSVSIYDITGKEIVKLVNDKSYQAGAHSIKWDGSDFSSGIYLYKVDAGSKLFTKKMILVK